MAAGDLGGSGRHFKTGPEDRPKPSLQDIYTRDAIAPPPHMREESRVDMGDADIPVERYFSKAYHDQEVEKVWRKTWQWACRLEDIPNVGDHIVYTIVHDSLIVVRTGTGPKDIRAYVNSCLHRGTMLRKEGGCVKQFRCPFHGFTWALDGTLKHVPGAWDFKHINPAEFSLPEARVDIWGGFVFINFDPEKRIEPDEDLDVEEAPTNDNLYRSVSELELSVRSINCLQNAKIETIADLVQKTEAEMLRTKNFGRKSLNEIKEVLTQMGLHLGMEVVNWPPDNIEDMAKKLEEPF